MANPTASQTAHADLVRICKIANRYLVFDPAAVSRLRRRENMSGLLVGTIPQQPMQDLFLGLPVELRHEEAVALAHKGSAYIVDDVAAHRNAFTSIDPDARSAYLATLRRHKQAAHQASLRRSAKQDAHTNNQSVQTNSTMTNARDYTNALFDESETQSSQETTHIRATAPEAVPNWGVTPTFTGQLTTQEEALKLTSQELESGLLCRHLHNAGHYMTPGLRFGSKYSTYPGDPLRYHAHFMANEYGWDEEINLLDIVGGGRLATAVKKALLIGGAPPDKLHDASSMTTFTIEWAGM